jgi:DNA polymerase-4/protein ImuB
MTIGCLLVPSLALACELAERPALAGGPVALTDEDGVRVAHVTPRAAMHGVRPGQTLREAVAYCPALTVLEQRPARVARAADALAEALLTVSPLVEQAAPGEVYADLRGTEGLYPEPGMLERAVLEAAPALLGLRLGPRLGVAGHRFTAYAAARRAKPSEAVRVTSDEAAEFLAPHPTGWLPLDDEDRARLRLLGIDTIGAFAELPRHAVEAQFGAAGGRAWLAARGEDQTPLRPAPFGRERVVERSQAEPPLVSQESVLHAMEQLLGRALRQPPARRRFVRVVRLRATTEDDRLWERTQTMKEPTGDRQRLWTAIRLHLEHAGYPGPIAGLELELGGLTAESGRQVGLFEEFTRRREQLDEMVRHLKVRYGQSPLARVVEVEPWSRIPERRVALMDYDP